MNKQSHQPDTFPQFRSLSTELRLMIWEYTWPVARLVEGAIREDETAEEYEDAFNNAKQ
jgi:hypothetical protein